MKQNGSKIAVQLKKSFPMNALIIDDEIEICYLLTNILRNKGIHTSYVYSLTEAEKYLQHNEAAIIFLDNHLPDGLGIEFLDFIKDHYPDTKVTIITGHELQNDMETAVSKGAIDFVSKPFTQETIYHALARMI
jgi:two-component system, OmpR family, response regulator